ncbi:MAG: MFS transporter [Verrucomicrobiae bacterium]|nr:MFS transporter [Verrucomicrobiae bacterium]
MSRSRRSVALVALLAAGFVSLGLPDGMLGVAWPSMRRDFDRPLDALGAILILFTAGYLASSFGTGAILARMRVGTLLTISAFITGLCLLTFAIAPAWVVVVAVAGVAGLGAGAIDAGLNAYAATHHSPATLHWIHAAYGVGAAASPLFLGHLLARGGRWQTGYAAVGVLELVLAGCFLATRHWWHTPPAVVAATLPVSPATATIPVQPHRVPQGPSPERPSLRATLGIGRVQFGIAVFFVYTGLEAAVGTWAFTLLTAHYRLPEDSAGHWVGAYWGSLAAGRVLAGVFARRLAPLTVIRLSAGGLMVGTLLPLCLVHPATAQLALIILGIACAPVFPLLIALTPHRVGAQHATSAVGFQIAAATLGQSLIPTAIGWAGRTHGLRAIPFLWFTAAAMLLLALPALARLSRNHSGTRGTTPGSFF